MRDNVGNEILYTPAEEPAQRCGCGDACTCSKESSNIDNGLPIVNKEKELPL